MEHKTIIHSDAIEFIRGLEKHSVDMLITDPPFGTNSKQSLLSTGTSYEDITVTELVALMTAIVDVAIKREVFTETAVVAILLDHRGVHQVATSLAERLNPRGEIIWHFETGGVSKSWWSNKHNTILLYEVNKNKGKFNYSEMPKTVRKAPKGSGAYAGKEKLLSSVWNHTMSTTDPQRVGYPTQKPEHIIENLIKVHSNKGDTIVDPFCGSGTVGAVAKRLGRQWVMGDANLGAITTTKKRLDATEVSN